MAIFGVAVVLFTRGWESNIIERIFQSNLRARTCARYNELETFFLYSVWFHYFR